MDSAFEHDDLRLALKLGTAAPSRGGTNAAPKTKAKKTASGKPARAKSKETTRKKSGRKRS
jgi:hypothetical protein